MNIEINKTAGGFEVYWIALEQEFFEIFESYCEALIFAEDLQNENF